MKRHIVIIAIIAILALVIVGCSPASTPHETINKNLNVQGVHLGMAESQLFKQLETVSKENCVYGYECQFEKNDLVVGLDFENQVRRIRTSHPSDAIYGIKPGISLSDANKALLAVGFKCVSGTKKYEKDGYIVELLSMENTLADQISIEIVPAS